MSQEQPFTAQIRNTANVTLDVLLSSLSANVNAAYQMANGAANTVAVLANSNLIMANALLNFNNTATINVFATSDGTFTADVAFGVNTASIQTQVTPSYNQANSAYNAANNALAVAEAAYGVANTGVSNSGVSAGSYGAGNQTLTITVDARGRVTGVSSQAYATFSPTSAGIVSASGGGSTNVLYANGVWAAAQIISEQSLASNGYVKFSNGLILQWGTVDITNGSSQTCNYTTAFPNAAFFVTGQMSTSNKNYVAIDLYTASQFVVSYYNGGNLNWFAIGH